MGSGDDMNVSERLTGLMNAVRGVTGVTQRLTIDEAITGLNGVSGFVDHGIISMGDMNSLTETGTWATHGALKNIPEKGPWGVLAVYAPSKGRDYVLQKWTSANDAATYVRIKNPDAGTWTAWIKLGG